MAKLLKRQKRQEEQYTFPYHYLDLMSDYQKLLLRIEYLDLLKSVRNTISHYNPGSILDIGCGDGRLCYELKDEKYRVTGVDMSERAISFAKAFNPGVKFFVQDIEKLDLPEKFDLVVLMEVLEHFPPTKIPVILSNLSKVLKKDGKLIITVPSKNAKLNKKHFQHFTVDSLQDTLKPYFEIISIKGYGKIGYKREIFTLLRKIGLLVFIFRNKISLARSFLMSIRSYYRRNISIGRPEECTGLIAVCLKAGSARKKSKV